MYHARTPVRACILLFFLISSLTVAGQYGWIKNFPGQQFTAVDDMVMDEDNNIFVTGNYASDVSIGNETLTGGGSFLVKMTSSGDVVWYKKIANSGTSFLTLTGVEIDGSGNVYATGQFFGTINIDGVVMSTNDLSSLIVKFNNNGTQQWIKPFIGVQEVLNMDVNDAGNIALTALLIGTTQVDQFTLISTFSQYFSALLTTDGTAVWTKILGSPSGTTNWPISVALDNADNAFFCGRYTNDFQWGDKHVSGQGTGYYNLYFTKVDKLGNCIWLTDVLRDSYYTDPNVIERGDLTIGDDGNIYACGTFYKNMEVETITVTTSMASLNDNFYVLKLDGNGHALWNKPTYLSFGGNSMENVLYFQDQVYVSGTVSGYQFYRQFSASGDVEGEYVTFPLRTDISNGLALDSDWRVYLCGRHEKSSTWNGHVFKVDTPTSIGSAGTIHAPALVCHDVNLSASLSPIVNATSYEWKIVADGVAKTMETDEPHIEINLSDLGNVKEITLTVRGVNDDSQGTFSEVKKVEVITVTGSLEIEMTTCGEIVVNKGDAVSWYRDNQLIRDVPQGQQSLYPKDEGEYFITESTACGELSSNVIEVLPQDPIFIPNIITSNGDIWNQTFIVDSRLNHPELTILSRWGEIVFHTPVYNNDWSGSYISSGVYYYVIQNPCSGKDIKGPLTVVNNN